MTNTFDLTQVALDMEKYYGEIYREDYLNRSGQKDKLELTPILKKYDHLLTLELFQYIKDNIKSAGGEDIKRLEYLSQLPCVGFLDKTVSEINDEIRTMESQIVVNVNGQDLPFRSLYAKVMNEADRNKRSNFYKAVKNVHAKDINPLSMNLWNKVHQTAKDMGYRNYVKFCEDIYGIDYNVLSEMMNSLVRRTDSLYRDKMSEHFKKKLNISLEEAEAHDYIYMRRGVEFDSYFKKENLMNTFRKTLKGLGINIDKQKNIMIDIEERDKKVPRAACFLIRVPDEIILMTLPQGGRNDYEGILHEGGHAEHYAFTDPKLEPEFKYLGDISTTESYAYLLAGLTHDRNWLKEHIGIEGKDLEEYIEFSYLDRLFMIRRYTGKLNYELQLHSADSLDGMDEVYRKSLEDALLFKVSKERYLRDVDNYFYASNYLRAWVLDAQLGEYFEIRHGDQWFSTYGAGNELKKLWSYGNKYGTTELSRIIGQGSLDITPLIREIGTNLGG